MKTVLVASMLLLAPMAASAGEVSYTAEDVVEFFAKSANLGPERGICIGTAEECGAIQERASVTAFDVMVNFELDSDRLSEAAKANLAEFSKALSDRRLAHARFSIEGHTDALGSESYNQRLSERRAEAVVKFLHEKGIDPSRLVVTGYGQSNPRTADPYDPVNRRVETRIVQ
jgi:OmpA-OmpF porin, OOP family